MFAALALLSACTGTAENPAMSSTSIRLEGPPSPTGSGQTPNAFRAFLTGLDDPTPRLGEFASGVTDDALLALAKTSCTQVRAGMTHAEFEAAAVFAGNDMGSVAPDLSAADRRLVFGAMAGLHCPERLPVSGRRLTSAPADLLTPTFRATIDRQWTTDHPLPLFVDAVNDNRVAILAAAACDVADSRHSITQFGMASVQHFDTALTEDDRATLGAKAHSELFGALVGWFCPERLPTIG